jgi:hypothetical protein
MYWPMSTNIPIILIQTHNAVKIPYNLQKLDRHYNGKHYFLATSELNITRLLPLGSFAP